MAENELIVTAGLDFQTSEDLIISQLKQIQDGFNKSGGLQINCTINDAAIKQLQANLESISKNLTIGVDSNTLQQSINQAVKSEPIKVNVEADIKSGELKRQAKEFKEMWKIGFFGESKDDVKALNAQLREMLSEYDKAMKAQDQKAFEESWQKLTDFVNEYINTIRVLTPEAEKLNSILSKTKVLIGYESTDYSNLEHAYGNQNKMTEILNESLGIGNWSYIKGKASYGFDSLVGELNSSLFKDADKISEHIVEGLEKIAAIRNSGQTAMAEWVKSEEEALSQDASYWAARKDAVLDSLYTIRNEVNPAKMEWTEILSDDDIQQGQEKIRAYTEVLEEGKRKIEALKTQIKAEGGDEIKAISSRFTGDAAGNLDGFVLAVQKSNGEVENLYHKLKETEDETGNLVREWERVRITGSDSGIDKVLDRAVKSADALSRKMNNLYAGATDQNAARPIKTEAGRNAIAEAYDRAVEAVNALRNANALTFAEMDNEAKVAIDNLNNVIKMQRNAETAATKLRTKSVTEIKSEELLNLDQFVTTITDSAIPNVEHLKQEVENLRTQLQQVGAEDKQGLINYLIAFSNLDEEFKTLNTEAKSVKKSLSDLDKLAGNTQFKNNATNESVMAQQADIEALRNKYLALFEEIGKANTPQALQAISTQLSELKPEFDSVTQSAVQLQNTLKSDDSEAKLAAKINNLKNQVEVFANTNRRATESLRVMRDGETTFAQGFQNIRDTLSRGNLDATGLQRLKEQFQNFRGEADAAGLTVSRFFQSMQSQLRMVLQRWISLYAVIGYIRKMIDNVKELDNAMINLRRVTDETDAGYQRFLEDANKLARQMKTTTASLVEMSYQWSKLGFEMNEALELSKASTIFMRVADVGQDQALSNLVTSLKAFRLEASQTMDVVDKLDKLNNEYAVSASGLGQGLERSASAMAMTGNSLEETLAMLTGAGEITQNLENTGNALRVISLR